MFSFYMYTTNFSLFVFFLPVLCLTGWPPEQHHSGLLAICLPVGFNQWQALTRGWRMGDDKDYVFITLDLYPFSSCLDTGLTVIMCLFDLGCHSTTFLPQLQLLSCFRNIVPSPYFLRLRVAMASYHYWSEGLYLFGFFNLVPML